MFDFVKRLFKKELSISQENLLVEKYLQDIVLENGVAKMIISYAFQSEEVRYFTKLTKKLNIRRDIFTKDHSYMHYCEWGMSREMFNIIRKMQKTTTTISADSPCVLVRDYKLDTLEIYEIIIKFINTDIINWYKVGKEEYGRVRIYRLPFAFLREFQDRIDWSGVGCSSGSRFEDLPIKFIKEFRHKIDWDDIGCGRDHFAKIEDLPIEHVREFKDDIDWFYIGSSIWPSFTKLKDLPIEFVREFQDKFTWFDVTGNKEFVKELSVEFVREFEHKLRRFQFENKLDTFFDDLDKAIQTE